MLLLLLLLLSNCSVESVDDAFGIMRHEGEVSWENIIIEKKDLACGEQMWQK